MNSISERWKHYDDEINGLGARLVAVSKTKPIADLQEAYHAGCRIFGENKVQEMVPKWEALAKDIEWHFIGHLQRNKVKYMASFVHLIHSVDSPELLDEINKQGAKHNRVISVLLQVYIAREESKFGFSNEDLAMVLEKESIKKYPNVLVVGLMGMASNTEDKAAVSAEFAYLLELFEKYKNQESYPYLHFKELSMGMSGDYQLALEKGSTLVRIGSSIFGSR